MPYGPRGFRWLEGEIPGLPQTPGGVRPPAMGQGSSMSDYLQDLIRFYTTPRNRQVMTRLDGGVHYGPSREPTVGPQDMETAAGLMDLMSALNAERDLEERRELAMRVLKQPMGGGTMSIGPTSGTQATKFGAAIPGGGRSAMIRPQPETLSRRDAVAIGGEPMSDVERDVEMKKAEAYGSYYGAKGRAAEIDATQLNAAQLEQLRQISEESKAIKRELAKDNVTDMRRKELEADLAELEGILRQYNYGGAGADTEIQMDMNGNRITR